VPRSWARDWRGLATRSTEIRTRTRRREPEREEGPQAPAQDARWAHLDPRLVEELSAGGWDHGWRLTPTAHAPLRGPTARQETWTLEGMIEPFARDQLALAEERSVLDLNCGEGWLAQRLLDWGARRVVAIDDRSRHLHRARLLRAHFAIPETELDLRPAESAATESGETFDIVLLVGAPERMLDDRLVSSARETTRGICAIESLGGDSVAVAKLALAAGFTSVERVPPPLQGAPRYVLDEHELLIARTEEAA